MRPPLRVGVFGLSHDHIWPNLAALTRGSLGRLVAAADPDPELRARLTREQGAVDLYDSFDALLDRRDIDAFFVYSDNRRSAELATITLERGTPTMIEKPMAADLAGAEKALAASVKSGATFMVNWPTAWRPSVQQAIRLVKEGAIGEPIQVSHRGSQIGPKEYGCSPQFCEWLYDPHRNGAGVLIDYCCYGAVICREILGRPEGVTAVAAHLRKPDLPSEDNAIAILRYPRALGLLEASWTQIGLEPSYAFIVYGDRGTILVHQPKAAREGGTPLPGRVQLITLDKNEMLDPPPPPPDATDGPTYFLSRVLDGRPVESICSPFAARDAQAVLDAALRSAAEGREVRL